MYPLFFITTGSQTTASADKDWPHRNVYQFIILPLKWGKAWQTNVLYMINEAASPDVSSFLEFEKCWKRYMLRRIEIYIVFNCCNDPDGSILTAVDESSTWLIIIKRKVDYFSIFKQSLCFHLCRSNEEEEKRNHIFWNILLLSYFSAVKLTRYFIYVTPDHYQCETPTWEHFELTWSMGRLQK